MRLLQPVGALAKLGHDGLAPRPEVLMLSDQREQLVSVVIAHTRVAARERPKTNARAVLCESALNAPPARGGQMRTTLRAAGVQGRCCISYSRIRRQKERGRGAAKPSREKQ